MISVAAGMVNHSGTPDWLDSHAVAYAPIAWKPAPPRLICPAAAVTKIAVGEDQVDAQDGERAGQVSAHGRAPVLQKRAAGRHHIFPLPIDAMPNSPLGRRMMMTSTSPQTVIATESPPK